MMRGIFIIYMVKVVQKYRFLIVLQIMLFLPGWINSHITYMTLPAPLQQFDYQLFHLINSEWNNSLFDAVLPFLREANFWLPFYLFLLLLVTFNFGKQGGWWVLMIILTAVLSDILSSSVLKENLMRLRPCQDPSINGMIRILVNYCPRSSSFPSSHAVNHFAAATFIYQTLKFNSKWWRLIFLWAFAIIYAQVYVGVHYPVDVFCGALIGMTLGWITSYIFNSRIGLQPLPKQE
ncbi:MAG: phosphatase PAP2 family protein [Sphingobacteriales bacterium]|nr:MAG: phosphatase PAP2 family protein [Sphingobacteriales bacterium]